MPKISPDKINVNEILRNYTFEAKIMERMIRVKRCGGSPPCSHTETRGKVKEFTISSGLRFQEAVSMISNDLKAPYWIGLTYPKDYPGNWSIWKKHLHNFRRSMWDEFGENLLGGVWRLEAQKRGAPHYHILLYHGFDINHPENEIIVRTRIAEIWYRVVASGDIKHLKAGTSCTQLRGGLDLDKCYKYITGYMGKGSVHPDSQVFKYPVGRYWGVWHKEKLMVASESYQLGQSEFLKVRRVIRKYRLNGIKERSKVGSKEGSKEGSKTGSKRSIVGSKEAYTYNNREIRGLRGFMSKETSWKLLNSIEPEPADIEEIKPYEFTPF